MKRVPRPQLQYKSSARESFELPNSKDGEILGTELLYTSIRQATKGFHPRRSDTARWATGKMIVQAKREQFLSSPDSQAARGPDSKEISPRVKTAPELLKDLLH